MIFRFVDGMFTGVAILLSTTVLTLLTLVLLDMLGKEFKIIYIFMSFLFVLICGLIGMSCS